MQCLYFANLQARVSVQSLYPSHTQSMAVHVDKFSDKLNQTHLIAVNVSPV